MLTKAEKTKQFILETAVPLYNEKGIAGVSIDDVLSATKLTKGCLYGHFDSKDALSEQVIELALRKITDRVRMATLKGKTAKTKLFAFIDFYKNPLQTSIPGGCPIINTAVEVDDNHPVLKEMVAKVLRTGQENLVAILQEGIDTGEFSDRLNPSVFAFKLVATIEGAMVMCRVMDTIKPMQAIIRDLKMELEQYSV